MKINIKGAKEILLADGDVSLYPNFPLKIKIKGIRGEPIFEELPFDLLTIIFESYRTIFEPFFELDDPVMFDPDNSPAEKILHPTKDKLYTPPITFSSFDHKNFKFDNYPPPSPNPPFYQGATVFMKIIPFNAYNDRNINGAWGKIYLYTDLNQPHPDAEFLITEVVPHSQYFNVIQVINNPLPPVFPSHLLVNETRYIKVSLYDPNQRTTKEKIYQIQVYYKAEAQPPEQYVHQLFNFLISSSPTSLQYWTDNMKIFIRRLDDNFSYDPQISDANYLSFSKYLHTLNNNYNPNTGIYTTTYEITFIFYVMGQFFETKTTVNVLHHDRILMRSNPDLLYFTLRNAGLTITHTFQPEETYPKWWNNDNNLVFQFQVPQINDRVENDEENIPPQPATYNPTFTFSDPNNPNITYASLSKTYQYQKQFKKYAIYQIYYQENNQNFPVKFEFSRNLDMYFYPLPPFSHQPYSPSPPVIPFYVKVSGSSLNSWKFGFLDYDGLMNIIDHPPPLPDYYYIPFFYPINAQGNQMDITPIGFEEEPYRDFQVSSPFSDYPAIIYKIRPLGFAITIYYSGSFVRFLIPYNLFTNFNYFHSAIITNFSIKNIFIKATLTFKGLLIQFKLGNLQIVLINLSSSLEPGRSETTSLFGFLPSVEDDLFLFQNSGLHDDRRNKTLFPIEVAQGKIKYREVDYHIVVPIYRIFDENDYQLVSITKQNDNYPLYPMGRSYKRYGEIFAIWRRVFDTPEEIFVAFDEAYFSSHQSHAEIAFAYSNNLFWYLIEKTGKLFIIPKPKRNSSYTSHAYPLTAHGEGKLISFLSESLPSAPDKHFDLSLFEPVFLYTYNKETGYLPTIYEGP